MSTRNDKDKDKGVNVQVLLRCRPPSEDELRANAPQVISCQEHRREVTVYQNIASKQIDRTFTFDKVFGPTSQQRDLYDQAISPIVNEVLEGFNCTIFAYGQTGTGKTYTMEGAGRKAKSGELPIDAGVIPRAIQQIFDTLESQNAEYSVKVTFLELYNEEITDLLAPEEIVKVIDDKQKKPLALMEDGKGGVLVRGLEEEIVATANEIYSLLDRGSAKRRTAETLLNKQSSRSHSIFSITIHIKEATPEGEELIKCGKLNLVDLAGSENISRSGAREGRAREAGEINKSLLTLGRVITALVEHLGHIPYRDSKLTRLLRDSLGGRTKTCIIATVSPSVHCLEETLSTLDYAHRAKNIRNKPEVNQKMMKSALIKDLYGEIEKLKSEVYAAREKNGIYVPRERYYQDEAEKKAMAEKIEQMECDLEAKDKQIEDMQELSDSQRQQISDLKYKLDNTQKILEQTEEALLDAKDDAKQAHYSVKEHEFVILHQRQAENSLVEQACQLRSQLEAAAQDIKGLFEKIEHKENIETENQKVVQKYQCELSQQLLALDSTVNKFVVDQQNQIQSIGIKLHNFNVSKEKAVEELKERISCLKAVCASQFEIIQAVTVDHESKASTSAKNMNDMINGHAGDLNNLLLSAASEAEGLLTGLQSVMAEQQCELAAFAQQQREAAFKSREAAGLILTVMKDFFVSLDGNISELGQYMDASQRTRDQSLADLHQAYEDRTRQDENDLLTGIANLLAGTMHQTREVIAARVKNLRDSSVEDSKVLQQGMTKAHEVTCKAQERLHAFNDEAEANALEASAFLAAKHCRMEELLQHCVKDTATSADQWRTTVASLQKLEGDHVPSVVALIRQLEDENALHTTQLKEVEVSAQSEIVSKHEFIVDFIENTCTAEKEEVNSMQSSMTSYSLDVGNLEACHKSNLEEVHKQTDFYLKDKYLVDQPTANTPTKRAIDIPNRSLIEELRAPGLEVLLEEYREKNSPLVLRRGLKHENGLVKEAKSFAASDFLSKRETRIPLMTVNRLER